MNQSLVKHQFLQKYFNIFILFYLKGLKPESLKEKFFVKTPVL